MSPTPKEYTLQSHIERYPNFLTPDLPKMPLGKAWGDTGVYFSRKNLEDGTQPDIVFVTERRVYVVEMKRETVDFAALKQLRGYLPPISQHYPRHQLSGYLVGVGCPDRAALEEDIGDEPIRILLFDGIDLPERYEIDECPHCYSGIGLDWPRCPVCKCELPAGL